MHGSLEATNHVTMLFPLPTLLLKIFNLTNYVSEDSSVFVVRKDSLVWMGGKTHQNRCILHLICDNVDTDSINLYFSFSSFHLPTLVCFISVSLSPFLLHGHSLPLCLCCLSDCEFVFHSVCQSAVTLSRLFFFSGLSRVGWGQGSEKLIPHNPSLPGQVAAPLAARTHLHKHARTHAGAFTLFLEKWSFCVAWQWRRSSLSSARGLQWTGSLCLSLSTFTCTHKTRLLREIRIRQGLGECNYMRLY